MFATLLLLAAAAGADPLAEARAGKLQCVAPNRDTRTCRGIVRYTVLPDGSFDSATTVMVMPAPLITMEIRNSGKVEGDVVCSVLRQADYDNAILVTDGQPLTAAQEQGIRAQIAEVTAPMKDKNACSRMQVQGDVIFAEAILDGVAEPQLNQPSIWVAPEDGWKVGS